MRVNDISSLQSDLIALAAIAAYANIVRPAEKRIARA